MSGEIVLDISRLISRADRCTPTGIDRVEAAYAERLITAHGARLHFAMISPLGQIARLPRRAAERFVRDMAAVWSGGECLERRSGLKAQARRLVLHALADGGRGLPSARRGGARPTYLLVSHHHLDRPAAIARMRAATGARFVTLVHDVIPVEFPEYQRPGFDERHALRMATVSEQSDAVIVNSRTTAAGLAPFLATAGRDPPIVVALLGVHAEAIRPPPPSPEADARPYFVSVSTLEPRKNHILLFNVWKRLAETMGSATPHLHVVGFRGWHNEAVFDVLDRSIALRPHVSEHGELDDRSVSALLAGARASLAPSFAEGFGLPVVEALAAGVPALCSDITAFREVGGEAPEYLDPLDGPAWLAAIRDYSAPRSPRRDAQLERIAAWRSPSWDQHFARVEPLLTKA